MNFKQRTEDDWKIDALLKNETLPLNTEKQDEQSRAKIAR